jgi:hypothetical protein
MKSSAIMIAVLAAATPAAADVVVKSTTDTSRCSPTERAQNKATLRRALDRLALQLSSASAHVDATIVGLTVEQRKNVVVVSAEVRLAISDENGKIISLLAGGAKVETPRGSRAPKLGRLRDDAVAAAVEGMFDKVKIAITQTDSPPAVSTLTRPNKVVASW